jgi:hypothetical protein
MTGKAIENRSAATLRIISEWNACKWPRRTPDLQGQIALMLSESILHVLVEQGVITKAAAIEAIETVGDATREMAHDNPTTANCIAADFVKAIVQSFMLKD